MKEQTKCRNMHDTLWHLSVLICSCICSCSSDRFYYSYSLFKLHNFRIQIYSINMQSFYCRAYILWILCVNKSGVCICFHSLEIDTHLDSALGTKIQLTYYLIKKQRFSLHIHVNQIVACFNFTLITPLPLCIGLNSIEPISQGFNVYNSSVPFCLLPAGDCVILTFKNEILSDLPFKRSE